MRERLSLRFGVAALFVAWPIALVDGDLNLRELHMVAISVGAAVLLGALVGWKGGTRGRVLLGVLGWTPPLSALWMLALWSFNHSYLNAWGAMMVGGCASIVLIPILAAIAMARRFEPVQK